MKKPLMCRLGLHEYEGETDYRPLILTPIGSARCWHCGHECWGYGPLFVIAATVSIALCIVVGLVIWIALT